MFVYLSWAISPINLMFSKSEYHSHILHIFAQKTLLEFSYNSLFCKVINIFVILPLFCSNFDRKMIKSKK